MNTFRPFDKDNDDPLRAIAQKIIDQSKAQETKGAEEVKKDKEKK
jgi:hypothetical protein